MPVYFKSMVLRQTGQLMGKKGMTERNMPRLVPGNGTGNAPQRGARKTFDRVLLQLQRLAFQHDIVAGEDRLLTE